MKYVDDWEEFTEVTFDADNLTTPQYLTDWMDVSWANELFSDATMTMASRDGTATLILSLEHYCKYAANTATGLAHTTMQSDTTTTEEITASARGAGTAKIRTHVRYKVVLGGTWTGNVTCTVKAKLTAKRN